MKMEGPFLLILFVFVGSILQGDTGVLPNEETDREWSFKRSLFPDDFFFGTATAAYQYEGAWNVSGKGPSNWDNFTQTYPEMIKGNASGMVADNFYDHYPDDFKQMHDMGMNAVRISLSWPRILPTGRETDGAGVNPDGVRYYHKLIDDSITKGVEPFVTIFHWDIPQALEEEYGGFLHHKIVKDFRDYADFCFKTFTKVKYWITINEPWSYSTMGYAYGSFPPGRCSKGLLNTANPKNVYRAGRAFSSSPFTVNCPVSGDSGTEPYTVSHNLLLAHANAVQLYRRKYQNITGQIMGKIGIINCVQWMLPADTQSKDDIDAKNRALDFMYGWFMEPLVNGTYPASMIKHVGKRLPPFTKNQSELVKGSYDFIGLNYYTANYVYNVADCGSTESYLTDSCSTLSELNQTGHQIGPKAGSDWLYVYPQGLGDLLHHTKNKYDNPIIYVTENGVDLVNGYNIQRDTVRINYHNDHLHVLHDVMINKFVDVNAVDVRGYFVWSFLDNFEWANGYTVRFGLIYVNYFNETLTRAPKHSANWFKKCLADFYLFNGIQWEFPIILQKDVDDSKISNVCLFSSQYGGDFILRDEQRRPIPVASCFKTNVKSAFVT